MILFKSPEADVIPVLESIICPLNPPLVHMLDVVSVKERLWRTLFSSSYVGMFLCALRKKE